MSATIDLAVFSAARFAGADRGRVGSALGSRGTARFSPNVTTTLTERSLRLPASRSAASRSRAGDTLDDDDGKRESAFIGLPPGGSAIVRHAVGGRSHDVAAVACPSTKPAENTRPLACAVTFTEL